MVEIVICQTCLELHRFADVLSRHRTSLLRRVPANLPKTRKSRRARENPAAEGALDRTVDSSLFTAYQLEPQLDSIEDRPT